MAQSTQSILVQKKTTKTFVSEGCSKLGIFLKENYTLNKFKVSVLCCKYCSTKFKINFSQENSNFFCNNVVDKKNAIWQFW